MAIINPIRKWTTQKVDSDFAKIMREAAKERYIKNLEKKEPKLTEMTRLLMRTQAFKTAIFELKTKPRKEDLKF
jgi:hypothetical protein